MSDLFRIPVEYKYFGYVYVEGENIKDAIENAKENLDDLPLPDNPLYVDDSFTIIEDTDLISEVNR